MPAVDAAAAAGGGGDVLHALAAFMDRPDADELFGKLVHASCQLLWQAEAEAERSTAERDVADAEQASSLTNMLPVPPQVAEVLQQPWPSSDERAIPSTAHIIFQQYALRVGGVRSERDLLLLTREELPLDALPPLHIYPHGIRQHEVQLHACGAVELTDEQLTLAEQFHLRAFNLLQEAPRGPPLHHVGAAAPSPIPAISTPGCWSSPSAGEAKHYLLLPCMPKGEEEFAVADAEGWLPLDEHDMLTEHLLEDEKTLRLNDLQVQDEWQWQKEQRDSLAEGHAGHCSRPSSHTVATAAIPDTSEAAFNSSTAEIDWAYVAEFLAPDPHLTSLSDVDLLRVAPRSLLLYTPYSHRFYTNLSAAHQSAVQETPLSPFPKREYPSYAAYYQQRWGISVTDSNRRLAAAANVALTPLNVLHPAPLSAKRRAQKEPVMLLLPDATRVVTHVTSHFLLLLRCMPCIMHRLETDLLRAELAATCFASAKLKPFPLRMSLTSGNAQEHFPLPFHPGHTHSADQIRWRQTVDETADDAAGLQARMFRAFDLIASPMPTLYVQSYERLKFLGDSVLKLLITRDLLGRYPHEAEEGITRLKARLLNMRALAATGVRHKLWRYVEAHPFQVDQWRAPGVNGASAQGPEGTTSSLLQHTSLRSAAQGAWPLVSQHVLADLVSSLVGCAWVSGAEASCIQVMLALDLLHVENLAFLDASLPVPKPFPEPCDELFSGSGGSLTSRVRVLLASQAECERVLGYRFRQRGLYVQAFSHERWQGGGAPTLSTRGGTAALPSYERLELLGDAVLELAVSHCIVANNTWTSAPGELTFVRQKLVSNHVLASSMQNTTLHMFVEPAAAAASPALGACRILLGVPKLLADVLEALLGAVFVDSGCRVAASWDVYLRIMGAGDVGAAMRFVPHATKVFPKFGPKEIQSWSDYEPRPPGALKLLVKDETAS